MSGISEVDIRDMRDTVIRVEEEASLNGRASPFTMEEYMQIIETCNALILEKNKKIPRLFLPQNWWL